MVSSYVEILLVVKGHSSWFSTLFCYDFAQRMVMTFGDYYHK
jgi:hypothetical protein